MINEIPKKIMKASVLSALLISIFYVWGCGKKEEVASEATTKIFNVILLENDKVLEEIIKNSEKVPNLSALISVMEKGMEGVLEDGLKRGLEEETRILKDASNKNKDEFYEAYSRFTEHLSVSMKTGGVKISEYNRFYCPMVSKYWMSKGTEVNNPFAPDMRDCGEIKN